MVNQVRVVAILMMVQGGLEVAYGVLTGAVYAFMGVMMQQELANNPPPDGAPPALFMAGMMGVFVALTGTVLIVGALRIWAGVRLYQFRSRTFAIVSLVLGLGSGMTIYCCPTALALLIYGLIVLVDSKVIEAMEMQNQPNMDASKVIQHYNR